MYNPFEADHQDRKYHWNKKGEIVKAEEPDPAAIARSMWRYFSKENEKLAARVDHLTNPRDLVIVLRHNVDNIRNLKPYMRALIIAGSNRVYKYRYQPHMLSFSTNETAFFIRLHHSLINGITLEEVIP